MQGLIKQISAIVLFFILAGCGVVDSMTEGFKHAQEIADELEKSTGSKPFVGFHWNNGSLTNVNVTFSEIPNNKSIDELISLSKSSINEHFKQTPDQITVAFSVNGNAQ
jgi:hypothetical protein